MDPAQALAQKAPPADLEKNLKGLKEALKDNPDATESLMKKHDLPFQVLEPDEDGDKPFLLCRYNRIGDKYRSPWTNYLHPKTTGDAPVEDNELRELEVKINGVWESYKNLYYGHESVGSAFVMHAEKGGFQVVFGIQKKCSVGIWNSIHLVHVDEPEEKTCNYRVQTSILLTLEPDEINNDATQLDISATTSKEARQTCKIQKTMIHASHIENIGQLVEANEVDLRSNLERVLVPKTREIIDGIQKGEGRIPTGVNPLMGFIMDAPMFKKKQADIE